MHSDHHSAVGDIDAVNPVIGQGHRALARLLCRDGNGRQLKPGESGSACLCRNAGQPAELYFWRDNIGHEIDLLFESGDRLQPVEIKSGMTFSYDWLDAAKRWKSFAGDSALDPWIIHASERSFECQDGHVFSWRALMENPTPC